MISLSFEEFAVVRQNEADPTGQRWTAQRGSETREERLFSAVLPNGLIKLQDDHYLTVLSDFLAFESIPHVFAIWKAHNDSLVFHGFLDHYLSVSMASLKIDEILHLSPNVSLIKGSAQGGDAGGLNGTLWFAYWRDPFALNFVYRKDWNRDDLEPDVEVRLVHDFDKQSMHLKVELQERRILDDGNGSTDPRYSAWQNRAVDNVDLGALLPR